MNNNLEKPWFVFRDPRKVAAFVVLVVLALIFLCCLPAEAWRSSRIGRSGLPIPFIVVALWVGGWFFALFARGHDPYVTYGTDYGRMYRGAGYVAAVLSLLGALLLAFFYWT